MKYEPSIAAARARLAKDLRTARKKNPAIARLILAAMKRSEKLIAANFWGRA